MPWLRSLCGLLLCGAACGGDWPQWLGPTRDGASTEKVAPWKDAPKKLWSVPVGEGHSSPVVAGGRVFLHTRVKDKDAEELAAYDVAKGTPLWKVSYNRAAFNNPYGNGPRATPTVVAGKLYTFGVTGVLTCSDAESGKQLWQIDALAKFKAPNLFFGASSSPLLEDNKVLVMVGKGASVVAFDKDKGDVVWKSLDDSASYSSPVAFGAGKERQAVFLTQQGIVGLSPVDGSLFWKFPLVDKLSESSTTPVKIGGLLLGSSVTYGSVGLQLGAKDGKPTATEVWKNAVLTCYFSTPVAVGDEHAYMVTGALLPPQASLRCVEAKSGKELWVKNKVGKYHASLLKTGDGKLLLLDDAGQLVLLDPNPKEYRELARAKVCGETWAHPALSDGKLFIRDNKELICVQLGE